MAVETFFCDKPLILKYVSLLQQFTLVKFSSSKDGGKEATRGNASLNTSIILKLNTVFSSTRLERMKLMSN